MMTTVEIVIMNWFIIISISTVVIMNWFIIISISTVMTTVDPHDDHRRNRYNDEPVHDTVEIDIMMNQFMMTTVEIDIMMNQFMMTTVEIDIMWSS